MYTVRNRSYIHIVRYVVYMFKNNYDQVKNVVKTRFVRYLYKIYDECTRTFLIYFEYVFQKQRKQKCIG